MISPSLVVRAVSPTIVLTTESAVLALRATGGASLVLSDAGRQGPPGSAGSSTLSAVCSQAMLAGTAVFLDRATGQLSPADAGWKPSAFVVGLLAADTGLGLVGQAERAELTLPDWTATTGLPQLVAGADYFLAVGGGLSAAPPASNACTVLVGRALTASTMLVDVQPPIQL